MRKLKVTLSLFLALFIGFFLSSCSNKLDVETNIYAVGRRTKITVTVDFKDEESRIFKDTTPIVYLFSVEKGKANEQLDTKQLSFDGEKEDIGVNTKSKYVEFEDLEMETEYIVRVKTNYEGYDYTLAEKTVMTTDEGSSAEKAIEVSTVEEFNQIRYDRDGYFKLTADIDFANAEIEPMFTTSTNSFEGEIDGNGKTLKNFTIKSNNQYNGLIGYNSGTIKNLNIENMTLETSRSSEINVGLLAGYHAGEIDNVNISNSNLKVTCTTYSLNYNFIAGGLVGKCAGNEGGIKITNNKLTNINIETNIVLKGRIGGLVGEIESPKTIRHNQTIENNYVGGNLTVNQEIKSNSESASEVYVGGFVGALGNRHLTNSVAEMNITVTTKRPDVTEPKIKDYLVAVGGIAGYVISNSFAKINQAAFIGSINVGVESVFEAYVGGAVGLNTSGSTINNVVTKLSTMEVKAYTTKTETTVLAEEETPKYEIAYGLTYNLDLATATKDNVFTVNAVEVKYTGDENIKTVWEVNKAGNLDLLSDFVKAYLNK